MQQLPDTPIYSPDHDLYALSPFSQRLARTIRAAQMRENMVVGLNGIWGGGKSSVLNMTIAWLMAMEHAGLDRYAASDREEREAMEVLLDGAHPEEQENHLADLERGWGGASGGRTIVLRYNPWLVSGHDTLVSDFFRILADRIEDVTDKDISQPVRVAANRLADFMDLTKNASSGMGRLLALYAEASGGPSFEKPETGKRAGFLKGLFRKVTASPIPLTLQEARDQLAYQLYRLAEQGRHVLVVIEDIDRLQPEEVRPLLSMMKALGELPGLTYLIGYDRAVLERALGEADAGEGMPRFLEKIVQVDLDLPRVPGERLLDALIAQADEIFGAPLEENEREDLTGTFRQGRVLLSTPRDVGRLRNALVFADAATGRSIRTTDLARMEILRLKERDVFDWIMRNSIYFHPRIGIQSMDAEQRGRDFIEEGLARATKLNREAVADVLSRSFENAAWVLGGAKPSPQDRLHERDTRFPLYSTEGWEAYLQSFPDADLIEQEEWGYARHICGDLQKSRNYLQTLLTRRRTDGSPLLLSFLENLDRFMRGSQPSGLINAILEMPDDLVAARAGLSYKSAFRSLSRLVQLCDDPANMLTGLSLKEGVNPFAVLVVLEVFAEQLGLMGKPRAPEPAAFSEAEIGEAVSTVHLRMSSLPPERIASWFATLDVNRLLALGLDRKTLLQFTQKLLSKPSDELRVMLEELCTTWPGRHGVRLLLTRRPDPDLYPLADLRNFADRMARLHPDDEFYADFAEAAAEFLANPAMKDRTQRIKSRFSRDGEI